MQNAKVFKKISVICGYGQLGFHYLAFMRIFASAICKFRHFLVSRRGHDTQQGVDASFFERFYCLWYSFTNFTTEQANSKGNVGRRTIRFEVCILEWSLPLMS